MNSQLKKGGIEEESVREALRMRCSNSIGGVESKFLCASISLLAPHEPIVVSESASLCAVVMMLQKHRAGCVAVVDEAEKLVGIFSERDYILKVYGHKSTYEDPVSGFMTPDPVTVGMEETVAYALVLMSQGGFRHLPIVDDEGIPVGMVSVKDLVDYISGKVLNDLLSLDLELSV